MEKKLELGAGYYRFVAMFTWPPEADKVARERLGKILIRYRPQAQHELPTDADLVLGAAYSMTKTGTALAIGKIVTQYAPQTQDDPPVDEDVVPGTAYSLTGARTVLIIGATKSAQALYRFCSSIIFDSGIQVNFYHCVNFHETEGMWPDLEH